MHKVIEGRFATKLMDTKKIYIRFCVANKVNKSKYMNLQLKKSQINERIKNWEVGLKEERQQRRLFDVHMMHCTMCLYIYIYIYTHNINFKHQNLK